MLCDLVLEHTLCTLELMKLAKCVEFTPHSRNLTKEYGKLLIELRKEVQRCDQTSILVMEDAL